MKNEIEYIKKYLISNKVITVVFAYCFLAVVLKYFSIIDITIPCLWTKIFGMRCPGCGLTTATIELMHLNIKNSFITNPLIFILIPAFSYYFVKDYFNFRKKQSNS